MTKNPRKIWEKGMPLSKAIVEFSNFPDTGDTAEKRHFRLLSAPAEKGKYDPEDPFRFSPDEPEMRINTRNRFRDIFCQRLIDHLEVGKLIAAGIPADASEINAPEIIPEKLFVQFQRKPNYEPWEHDVFASPTAKYTEVRIHNPAKTEDAPLIGVPSEEAVGRPTKKDLIQGAYEECKRALQIDFKASQIEAVRAVQTYIRETTPDEWGDGSGLSEKAVGNHIRDAFNADKARYRSSKN